MKKVLIIAPKFMGYMEKVAEELRKNNSLEITDIHIPEYKYPNLSLKVKNFFLKKIAKDLKFEYRENYIKKIIGNINYDTILIVRPDMLSFKNLEQLKSKTPLLKAYFFDGINHYQRKLKTLKYFNEVYSFEPGDCEKFGLIPITNFIYKETQINSESKKLKYSVFNISSYDKKRFPILLKISSNLKNQRKDFKIIVKTNKKVFTNNLIEIILEPMSFEDIKLILMESICMLDLGQIKKHRGLTFRVFEAMGFHKKLITNNPDIINYDFYDPQNILIIDENNINIPDSFLYSSYNPIPKKIYEKYTLTTWVKTVFKEVL
jgi:hypothetical protein